VNRFSNVLQILLILFVSYTSVTAMLKNQFVLQTCHKRSEVSLKGQTLLVQIDSL